MSSPKSYALVYCSCWVLVAVVLLLVEPLSAVEEDGKTSLRRKRRVQAIDSTSEIKDGDEVISFFDFDLTEKQDTSRVSLGRSGAKVLGPDTGSTYLALSPLDHGRRTQQYYTSTYCNRQQQQCIQNFQSLVQALQNAQNGACIVMCPRVYRVTGPPIRISASQVTLVCQNAVNRRCTFQSEPNRLGRIIEGTGTNLRFEGITFQGGRTRSDINVNPNNMNVGCGNGVNGGAICLQGAGPHVVDRCTFRNNFSGGSGGALWSRTLVTFIDVDFMNNQARFAGGPAAIGGGARSPTSDTRADSNSANRCPNGIFQIQSQSCTQLERCQNPGYNDPYYPNNPIYVDPVYDRFNQFETAGISICGEAQLRSALTGSNGGTYTLCPGVTQVTTTVPFTSSNIVLNCATNLQNCIIAPQNQNLIQGSLVELTSGASNNVIYGLRFMNGQNTGSPGTGGCLKIDSGAFNNQIQRNFFMNCEAVEGGGLYAALGTNTLLIDNSFSGNKARQRGAAASINPAQGSGLNKEVSTGDAPHCNFIYNPGSGGCENQSPIMRSYGGADGTATLSNEADPRDGEDSSDAEEEGSDFFFQESSYDSRGRC